MPKNPSNSSKETGFVSISKAAKFLGVSADTLRNWEEQGKLLPKRTAGGARRYSLRDLAPLKKELNLPGKHIGLLSISKASKSLQVSPDTLRNWEAQGLISPQRTKGGARRYTKTEVKRLREQMNLPENVKEVVSIPQPEQPASKPSNSSLNLREMMLGRMVLLLGILLLAALGSVYLKASDSTPQGNLKLVQNQLYGLATTLESMQKSFNTLQTNQISTSSAHLNLSDAILGVNSPTAQYLDVTVDSKFEGDLGVQGGVKIADGLTASGSAVLSSLGAGIVHSDSNGLLSSSPIDIGGDTTGTVSVGRGGTGLSTVPTAGQLLVGNGSGYNLANITAGSGINVSSTATGITISNTAGKSSITSLNGTGNQVNLSASTGDITISLPQDIADSSTPTFSGLNLGSSGATTGAVVFKNSANSNTTTLQSGVAGSSITLTLPTNTGTNGDCLLTNGSGALSFGGCSGGNAGVSSLDGLTGAITIANSSGTGSSVTINNAAADGATKGIATFNATNFSASSGVINTIQDISAGSSPNFTGLTVSGLTATKGVFTDGSSKLTSSGTLGSDQGGTGFATYAKGDMIYASGVNTLSKLTAGSDGTVLTLASGVPTWGSVGGSGGICGDCVITDPSVNQTITPTGDHTGLIVAQTATGSPTSDIFEITNNGGGTKYLGVNSAGNLTVTGSATFNSISLGNNSGTISLIGLSSAVGTGLCVDGSNHVVTCSTGSSSATLQSAYGAGNTIATTTGRNIEFTLSSGLASPTSLTLTNNGTSDAFDLINNETSGNGILIEQNAVAKTLTNGLNITQSLGNITNAISLNGTFTNLINSTNFSVTNAGGVTASSLTLTSTPLGISSGGTGAANAPNARSNLGAAASGANADITSLSGLTTALAVSEGGTGISSVTSNGVLYGNGTGNLQTTSAGGAGTQCLVEVGGAAPNFSSCSTAAGGVTSATGTVNQVLVNSTSGSAQTGALTLTLPQDIATTSIPTFGGLILTGGTSADITTAAGGTSNALTFQPGNSTAATGTGANLNLNAGSQSGTTSSTGGSVFITAGSATGSSGTRSGGNVTIDSGAGVDGNGYISLGPNNVSALYLGRSGITTNNNGFLDSTGLITASGGVTLSANQNLTLNSGTGVYSQTFAGTNQTPFSLTSTFSPTGGGTQNNISSQVTNSASSVANTLRGINLSLSDSGTLANTDVGLNVDLTGVTNSSVNPYGALIKGTSKNIFEIDHGSGVPSLIVTNNGPNTSAPSIRLDQTNLVFNAKGSTGNLYFNLDSGQYSLFTGSVGIGTTTPSSFALQVAGNVGPNATDTYDLGSASLEWNNLYAKNINIPSSGSLTDAALTPGSVVFAGTGGALSQDNSNFFYDSSNHELGIGTTSPGGQLEVTSDVDSNVNVFATEYGSSSNIADFIGRKANGTFSSPSNVTGGEVIAEFGGIARNDSGWQPNLTGGLAVVAAEQQLTTNAGTYLSFLTTASGGTAGSVSEKMRLTDTGNLGISTTSPEAALHVSSTSNNQTTILTNPSAASANTGTWLDFSGNAASPLDVDMAGIKSFWNGSAATDAYLSFYTRGGDSYSEKMRLTSAGNLGIGTTTPTSFTLQVAGNVGPNATDTYNLGSSSLEWNNVYAKNITVSSSGGITDTSLTPGSVVFAGTGGTFSQDNSNFFYDSTNHELGIGTTPDEKLTIGEYIDTHPSLNIGNDVNNVRYGLSAFGGYLYEYADAGYHFKTGAPGSLAEPFTILSGGNVGIGQTNPTSGRLQIDTGNSSTGGFSGILVSGNLSATSSDQYGIFSNPTQNATNTGSLEAFRAEPDVAAGVTANNTIGLYLATPTVGSGGATSNNFGLFVDNERSSSGSNYGIYLSSPSLLNGIGSTTNSIALDIPTASISMGNQTATTTNAYGVRIGQVTYTSTTNTRTITNPASLYIEGAPVAGTNVSFTNPSLALNVASGNSYFGGNVGIGTTSPNKILEVMKTDTGTTLGAGTAAIRITNNTSTANSLTELQFANNQVSNSLFAAISGVYTNGTSNTQGDIAFSTRNAAADANLSERMRILADGNVGIGTSTPGQTLSVLAKGNTSIIGPTSGTWAGSFVNAQDGSGYDGLSVQNRWAASDSTIFEAAMGWNGSSSGYYPVFDINGLGDLIWKTNTGSVLADFVNSSGAIGIGNTPPAGFGILMQGDTISGDGGNNGAGIAVNPTFATSVTNVGSGVEGVGTVTANPLSEWRDFYAPNPNVSGSGTITTAKGLAIDGITRGTTNNYGIYINAPSGGSSQNIGLVNQGSSYFGGNVGINTTVPPYKLQVAPGGTGSGLGVGWNALGGGGTGETDFYNYGQGGGGGFAFYNYASPGSSYPTTGATNLMTILSDGNVGIGQTNPQGILDVTTPINTDTNQPRFLDGSGTAGDWNEIALGAHLASYEAGGLRYFNGNGTASSSELTLFNFGDNISNGINLKGGGNVGLGTTNPQVKLDVVNPSTGIGPVLNLRAGGNTSGDGAELNLVANNGSVNLNIYSDAANSYTRIKSAGALAFSAGDTSVSTANEFMTILSSGNIGINNTGPNNRLGVVGNIAASGSVNGGVGSPDYAENITASDSSITAADVVVADPNNPGQIIKSAQPYQNSLLGIISTHPGFLTNAQQSDVESTAKPDPNQRPLALSGRVPVKVSTENGDINVGDYLTSSSIPGVTMKATRPGPTVGKALESYSGSGVGKILVFINVAYADPTNVLANLTVDDKGNLIVPQIKSDHLEISNIQTTKLAALEDSLDPASLNEVGDAVNSGSDATHVDLATTINTILAAEADTRNKIQETSNQLNSLSSQVAGIATQSAQLAEQTASNSAQINGINSQVASSSAQLASLQGDVNNLKLTPPSVLMATGSASLANINVSDTISTLNLNTLDATVSGTLKELGDSFLGNTTVAGDLTVNGTFSLALGEDGTTDLNSLPDLHIQSSPLAQLVDFFNGLVSIDKNGTLSAQTVSAQTVRVAEFKVIGNKITGSGTLSSGQKSVDILNSLVTQNSRIFITPTTDTDMVLAVTKKIDGQKFTVSAPFTTTQDIQFDWWIVGEDSN